jgi:hypothetical protein
MEYSEMAFAIERLVPHAKKTETKSKP